MDRFIDLCGASGATYRFRAAEPEALPQAAGNFVFVCRDGGRTRVVCSGASNRLADAEAHWQSAVTDYGAQSAYIHLNTTRRAREAVHADIVAAETLPVVMLGVD